MAGLLLRVDGGATVIGILGHEALAVGVHDDALDELRRGIDRRRRHGAMHSALGTTD